MGIWSADTTGGKSRRELADERRAAEQSDKDKARAAEKAGRGSRRV